MATRAFSRKLAKLFSELKLATDNLILHLTEKPLISKLGPNSLIFSFSSGALSAHNVSGWALCIIHSWCIFLIKELDKHDVRRISARYTTLC